MARVTPLAVASLAVGLITTWIGVQGAGPLPPLNAVLSPSIGVWTNVIDDLPREAAADLSGLQGPVDIRYDQRSVPHIFATADLDVVRALGYVVARDRLFQLELQARAGEGTLTELVGEVALPADQETRRLGLPRAADQRWATMDSTTRMAQILRAYAEGINAYRATLSVSRYPIEYKLLQRTPRVWEPVHSLYVLGRMGYTLAHNPIELDYLKAKALVGDAAARALFDANSPVQEPIQPAPRNAAREALAALPAPGIPDSAARQFLAALTARGSAVDPLEWARDRDPNADVRHELAQTRAFASNNWAVAPTRTATGTALLAGDPHLELTLPSIWYEVHLVVPGSIDAGGVTIPGLPGIAIGYTRAFAWSFTNTGTDVLDFWRETVDNAQAPRGYLLDGALMPFADTRVEEYRDAKGATLAVDTVYYTHRGPMRRQGTEWLSMRWTVLEAGQELMGFYAGMQARTAAAFLDTMALYFKAPAQNMIVADTAGTIGIRSTGNFPIRADSGRGTVIRDGRTRAADWVGFRSLDRFPQSMQPSQGYLASANQEPIDPQYDPLYFGVDPHYEIWRALQINRLLRADSAVTPDAMRRYQVHPGSVRAERLVPAFEQAARARLRAGDTSQALTRAEALLHAWDRRYTRDNTGARLFETALSRATALLWDEFIPAGATSRVVTPSESRLLQLVNDSASLWWDDRRTTDVREDRHRILARALREAYDTLRVEFGDPETTPWTWGRTTPARPMHVLRLEGFSAPRLPIDGGRGTLNPSVASRRTNFGASWRMVAELGGTPRISAVYPGGQSGNPASPRYLDRLPLWAEGKLDSVRTPRAASDLQPSDVRAVLRLTPRGTR